MSIRARITPALDAGGLIHLKIEWVECDGQSVGAVLAEEEFRISSGRQGCAYVSRAEFSGGQMLPGTFWLDEAGLRHFILKAELGTIAAEGQPIGG